jgi:hypothetical protein
MIALGICLLAGLGIWLLAHVASTPPEDVKPTVEQPKADESSSAGESEYSPKHAMREQYANNLHALLRDKGYDIVVTELGDKLILADDLFEDTSTRVQFLDLLRKSNTALCNMGFRRLDIGKKGFFTSSDTYSLNCAETPDERKARIQADSARRLEYVHSLQRDLNNSSGAAGITLSQAKSELIVMSDTGVAETGPSVRQWRGIVVNSEVRSQLCDAGFTGVRLKNNLESKGVRISIRCN